MQAGREQVSRSRKAVKRRPERPKTKSRKLHNKEPKGRNNEEAESLISKKGRTRVNRIRPFSE